MAVVNSLSDNDIDFDVESDNEFEYTTNRHAANESLVINYENLLELSPGEDKWTTHILFDEKCEELPFPKIFFNGKFRYTFPRALIKANKLYQ